MRLRGTDIGASTRVPGPGLLLAACLLRAGTSRSRRAEHEPVSPELLAIGAERLANEQDFAERFNGRGSALMAVTGVVLGLIVNLGLGVFGQLDHRAGQAAVLNLGRVGTPIFVACFLGSLLSLATSAVLASTAVLPSKARRLTVEALRNYQRDGVPMADVRERVYTWTVNAVDDQRANNSVKVRRLRLAAFAFVSGIVFVALDAAVLALRQIGL